ncbi:Mediator of RNA polymerase II transcription subunit 12 [Strongyloides ratti]|uniref:Mediator of RNA polymerase II transcription subunit 12 n=1 Tax=Strongyloides ratti TaxID=34506 RepID=A0A090L4J3_STRRB|nr:Mediator of RNA polymerase II transcription subunit 12 [Strongyloides ratti]CEF62419.1 Mediator of RNA polymerase II transcription subunit 12 [Strongyloides ratti]
MTNSTKSYKISHWKSENYESRGMRKNSTNRSFDIFYQDAMQDEDNISSLERITSGYVSNSLPYEYDSYIFNQRNKISDDFVDKTIKKAYSFFDNLINKQCADSSKFHRKIPLPKVFQISEWNYKIPKNPNINEFFENLTKGKDFYSLIKKFPSFNSKENYLDYLYEYNVPILKAIWFIKIVAVLKATKVDDGKAPKKSQAQQIALEYVQCIISGYIIYTFKYLSTNGVYNEKKIEKWNYFALLIKHMFEEGVLDRQDFLIDIIDLLNIYVDFELEDPTKFRILFLFISQFSTFITQNIIIARRLAFVICKRLRKYHLDYMNFIGQPITCPEVMSKLMKCEKHRPIISAMISMFYSIMTECIQAITVKYITIDKKFTGITCYKDLTDTPLEYLTCRIDDMCKEANLLPLNMIEIMKKKIEEFKKRSIDIRYTLHNTISQDNYCSEVSWMILKIFSILDNIYLVNQNNMIKIYKSIFVLETGIDKEIEKLIKLRMIIHWCITSQRSGTYRVTIVVKLLSIHLSDMKNRVKKMITILNDYLNTEGPRLGYCNFGYEFRNIILLLNDLQSYGILRYKDLLDNWILSGKININECIWGRTLKYVYGENYERDLHPSWNRHIEMSSRYALLFYRRDSEKHFLINIENITMEERIFLQMPILPSIENKDVILYRDNIIYGISISRKEHLNYLKEVARGIIKVWKKLYYFKIKIDNEKSYFHEYHDIKRYQECGDILKNFRKQTYYDQTLITYWVANDFKSYITGFIKNTTNILPGSDGLDYIMRMFCISMNIGGMIEYIVNLLEEIGKLEDVMISRGYNLISGMITKSYAFTVTGYLSEHTNYFLFHPNAVDVLNGLFRTIENTVILENYPRTGYDTTIGMFIYYCKNVLVKEGITSYDNILGCDKHFSKLYPKPFIEIKIDVPKIKAKKLFFGKYLKTSPQGMLFSEFKYTMKKINKGGFPLRIAFILSALQTVKGLGRDINKISMLANYVSNVSVQLKMENEWISVILEMCSLTTNPNSLYKGIHRTINIGRTTTHYPISSFITILGGKYVFRPSDLIENLIKTTLISVFKGNYLRSKYGYEKVVLGGLICTKLLTGYHDPFKLPKGYSGISEVKRPVVHRLADFKACSVLFNHEYNNVIFKFIQLLSLANRPIRKIKTKKPSKRIRINHFFKACLLCLSEQPWFYQYMKFSVLQLDLNLLKNDNNLFKNYKITGTLLNFISREKGDRLNKLKILSSAEKLSKKNFIELNLESLNIWNFRSVLWSLFGMVNDIMRKPTKLNYAQKVFNCNQMITDIAKGIKSIFTKNSYSYGKNVIFKTDIFFRLNDISNLWLVEYLINEFPKINGLKCDLKFNKMSLTPLSRSVFIELSSLITESYSINEYGRKTEQISHLFHLPPFSKLIQTLANVEPLCSHGLLQGVYSYLTNIVKEFNSKRILCPQLLKDKDGIILRVLLVCGMMDQLLTMPTVEPWAYLLWQLLYLEIIHKEREEKYYYICYEALSTILFISTFKIHQRHNEKLHYKARYKAYSHFCKKIRRECQDRPFPINKLELSQLLPLPKRTFDYIIFDYYYNYVGKIQNVSKIDGSNGSMVNSINQTGFYPVDKIKLTTFEIIPSFFHENLGRRAVNYTFYQAQLVDYNPRLERNTIIRLLFHKHNHLFPKVSIYGDCKILKNSFFYKPPAIEYNVEEKKETDSPLQELINMTSKSKSPIQLSSKKQVESNEVKKSEDKVNLISSKELQIKDGNNENPSNSHNKNLNYVNEPQTSRDFNLTQQAFNGRDLSTSQNGVMNPSVSMAQPNLPQHANHNHLISQPIKNNTYSYQSSNSFYTSESQKALKRSLDPSPTISVKKRKDNTENIPISSIINQQNNPNNINTNNILPRPITNVYIQPPEQRNMVTSQQSEIPQQNTSQQTNQMRMTMNQQPLIPPNIENFSKQPQQHIPQHTKTIMNPQMRGNGIESGAMHQNIQQGRQNLGLQNFINPQQKIPHPGDRQNLRGGFENTNIMSKDMIHQKNNFNQNIQHQQQYNVPMNNQHLNQGPMMDQYQINLRKEMIYRNNQQQNQLQFHDPNMARLYNQGNPQQQQPINRNQMYPR